MYYEAVAFVIFIPHNNEMGPYLSALLQSKPGESPFTEADNHKPYIEARNEYALEQNAVLAGMLGSNLFASLEELKKTEAIKHIIYIGYELKQPSAFEEQRLTILEKLVEIFKTLAIFNGKTDPAACKNFCETLISFAIGSNSGAETKEGVKQIVKPAEPVASPKKRTTPPQKTAEQQLTDKLASFFSEEK